MSRTSTRKKLQPAPPPPPHLKSPCSIEQDVQEPFNSSHHWTLYCINYGSKELDPVAYEQTELPQRDSFENTHICVGAILAVRSNCLKCMVTWNLRCIGFWIDHAGSVRRRYIDDVHELFKTRMRLRHSSRVVNSTK